MLSKKSLFVLAGIVAASAAGGAWAQASAVGNGTAQRLMPPAASPADVTNLTQTVTDLTNQILKGGGAKQIFSGEHIGTQLITIRNNSGAAVVINFEGDGVDNSVAYVTDSSGNYYDYHSRGAEGPPPKVVATVPGSVTTINLTSTNGVFRNFRVTALSSLASESDFVLNFLYTDVRAGTCTVDLPEYISVDQISGQQTVVPASVRVKYAYRRTYRSGVINYYSQGADEARPVNIFGTSYTNLASLIRSDYSIQSGGTLLPNSVVCRS